MLELFYVDQTKIPAGYETLYTEQDGKWVLTGIKGMKTQADIDSQKEIVKKEREKTKAANARIAELEAGGEDVDDLKDKIEDLEKQIENAGDGDGDPAKIKEQIDAAVDKAVERAERKKDKEIEKLTTENAELSARVVKAEGTLSQRDIESKARAKFEELGVTPEAMPDALLNARTALKLDEEGEVVSADGDPMDGWAEDLVDARKATWLPRAQGGNTGDGGGQGGGKSPFSKDGWDIQKQGAYVTEHGEAKAQEEAKRHGVTFGMTRHPENK